jgi:hypothetical protein
VSHPDLKKPLSGSSLLIIAIFGGVTAAFTLGVVLLVILSGTDPANTGAEGYLPLAYAAFGVIFTAIVVSACIRRVRVQVSSALAWLVGIVSFLLSFIPWWGIAGSNSDLGVFIYRGLRVPQGIMQFWDLSLVMRSVDCARWGFDIYAENNGCLAEPSIYAPGMVWLQYVPLDLFSEANVVVLGLIMMVISSVVLFSLARMSKGLGQIVLLIAAVGGPWLLLLERANIDSIVIWVAVLAAVLIVKFGFKEPSASTWRVLWPWIVAATLIWIVGTWKYYPFALGLMLLPALRIKRGWAVVVGFGVASFGYVILTWSNFQYSSQANSGMVDYRDLGVLGRIPVVARMLDYGDLMFYLLALSAVVWGVFVSREIFQIRRVHVDSLVFAMLAAGGSVLYLASVLVAGFGYGYKAVFLLLAVPLLSRWVGSRIRVVAGSSLLILIFIAIESFVVWNTVLATTVGVVAAAFALGASGFLLPRKQVRSSSG